MHLLDKLLLGLVGNKLFGALFVLQVAEVEPTFESLPVTENLRQQEIEQRPQLLEIVLQRCAGDQKTGCRGERLELAEQLGVKVLHSVSLVDNDELPVDLG